MSVGTIHQFPDAKPMMRNEYLVLIAYLSGHFSADECRRIVDLANAETQHDGRIGGGRNEQIRESHVSYVSPDENSQWVFAKMQTIILDLNNEYKFELNGFHEGLQIAEYSSPGGHYSWHNDIGTGKFSGRKLSMSVQLSGADEYEGGELEFLDSTAPAPKEIGSLIVFPSYLQHRVKPVTSGVRKSMVCWVSGPAFK
jgi:PKHD-type hydroxylase